MKTVDAALALFVAVGALACGDDDAPEKAADASTSSAVGSDAEAARPDAGPGAPGTAIADIIRRFGDGGFRFPVFGDGGFRLPGARDGGSRVRFGDGGARGPRNADGGLDLGGERERDGGCCQERDDAGEGDGGSHPEDATVLDASAADAAS